MFLDRSGFERWRMIDFKYNYVSIKKHFMSYNKYMINENIVKLECKWTTRFRHTFSLYYNFQQGTTHIYNSFYSVVCDSIDHKWHLFKQYNKDPWKSIIIFLLSVKPMTYLSIYLSIYIYYSLTCVPCTQSSLVCLMI